MVKLKVLRTAVLAVLIVASAFPVRGGSLLREVWTGIGGEALANLTNAAVYPNNPDFTNYVTEFFEAPTDVMESYGQRLHGYIVPPRTGDYTFWIASDDQGALFLSTDENPVNVRLIAAVNAWTASREWGKEANQQSAPVLMVAGKVYYVSALMKEGGGGDNLAVRWQMPDGTDQAPIVGTNLLPWGTTFTAPVIATHPQNTTAVEGGTARFDIKLRSIGPVSFQWQRQGTNIPGASAPELELLAVALTDGGARYACVVSNNLGAVRSEEAVLNVTPDLTPPTLRRLQNLGPAQLLVTFSEPVRTASATAPANYSLDQGVSVTGAVPGSTPDTVILSLSGLTYGITYTLTARDVEDRAQTPNVMSPEQQSFLALEFAPWPIGSSSVPGGVTGAEGGFDVRGSGQIGGTADEFLFGYQLRTGNFDVKARLAAFDPTDLFAQAGLMVRASLQTQSAFAAVLATPASAGTYFLSRTGAGTGVQKSGSFPVNYPETWLRLTRNGSTLTGYASFDGTNWTQLGSTSLALPSTVYFGLAVASGNRSTAAQARFRNIAPVTGAVLAASALRGEPLGPSSRHTALIISEIMYHPAERPDGKDLEFVELYNADFIPHDLSGWRLSGEIEFSFPNGYLLRPGAFAVVARNPADIASVYGLTGVLGPYTNSLANGSGTVRLRNPQDAALLAAAYGSKLPWLAAADGAGHSLVLWRPSYGEGDARAWAASEVIGGSPGTVDAVRVNPFSHVLINELLAHTDDPELDFIELYNHSNQTVDVSGCVLTDDPRTNRFRIPPNTRLFPRSFLSFDQEDLGFRLNAAGETIYLFSPDGQRVIDAVAYEAQENGVSSGRYPDGTAEIRPLGSPTEAAENDPFLVSDVVINEIMFHPIAGDDLQYVELHNRSSAAVNLAGWRLADGVQFRFPDGAMLPAGGYVVVGRDVARLLAVYPQLNTNSAFGDFDGRLSHSGERLALTKPDVILSTNEFGALQTNRISIVVDETTYGVGGRWGQWSGGLGSSLELVDPFSDHLRPASWADSDESAKADWGTIEFTGPLDLGSDAFQPAQFQMHLLGMGECLVDNIEVLSGGSANRLSNPGFESGLSGWTFQGNHRASFVETSGGLGGGRCLHVRATGRGDTGANRIRAEISPGLTVGSTATLRAKVRWLKGWPEILLRTRGNWIEAAGPIPVPLHLGTPGARNSQAVSNAGPAIFDVRHSPILPAGNQAAVVSARVTDPDGIASVRVRFRIDPASTLTSVTMKDDGLGGDAVAGDGVYSATIPGRSPGTLVAYRIEAADARSAPASALFPAAAPAQECLILWGETQPAGNVGVYRLWQRQSDYNFLRNREALANDDLDGTFVYGNSRLIYNFEMRAKGSPWHGGSVGADYLFAFPEDEPFLGARDVALVTVGNLGNDDTAQREQAAFWIGQELAIPYLHRRHVLFYENGARKGNVYEDTEEPNGRYMDAWFPDGEDGDLYKVEDWFEFDDGGGGFWSRDATLERFTTTSGALKVARYRWAWRKRAVVGSSSNYTNLFNLIQAVNTTGPSYVSQVESLVDIENWLREFALQHIVGNWDAYGYNRGKNSYIYKPVNDRWIIVPWDIDFVLGSGSDQPNSGLFGSNDPTVYTMWNTPAFARMYWRAFQDAARGPLQNPKIDPILDARYAALSANGITVADPNPVKSWIAQRRFFLESSITEIDTAPFAITSNNGASFNTVQSLLTLTGTAPIAVKTILINGTARPVEWTSLRDWKLTLALSSGANALVVTGLDLRGQPVPGAADSITVTYTGGALNPRGAIVINEIMYHSPKTNAAFIELFNTSTAAAFDLSRWRLEGVNLVFPEGVTIPPRTYLVLASNRDGFRAAYGAAVLPVAEFPGALDNGGEVLRLVRPGATPENDLIVDEVRYDDELPWPAQADGFGPSLQLRDALQDNWRPANWAATATNAAVLATPGAANNLVSSVPTFPDLWINEVLPENLGGRADGFGDRDPWIELFNHGTNSVDLSGYYLTSNYTNLTAWAFPAGTALPGRSFLLVWADGETGESSSTEFHANFRLAPEVGAVALVRLQAGTPSVVDYLNYKSLPAGRAYGLYPDGVPADRRLFHLPTPGEANNPGAPPVQVFINEWMASNRATLPDPRDQDYDDWFELFNAGGAPVDLSAFWLTDTRTNITKFSIPNGTVIPAGGFLLVWADEESSQNTPGGDLHANFKLANAGEEIGLFAPDGRLVDALAFGVQTNDISEGRFPDGQAEPFYLMGVPTPRQANVFATVNQPPVLDPLSDLPVDEGATVRFTAEATDADVGQRLTFALLGAPPAAGIDPESGECVWSTAEADGPGAYTFTVVVTDDGAPRRSARQSMTVDVREVNRAPDVATVPDQALDEGALLALMIEAADLDLPKQSLAFSLEAAAPAGAAIDPVTGLFTWRPLESQGPQTWPVTVRVTDSGVPPATRAITFQVTVREVDNPPAIEPVLTQTIDELVPFALQIQAADPDGIPQVLLFELEKGASGMSIDGNGLFRWTPSEGQGPNSYGVTVRVSEAAGASASITFSIVVAENNQAPELDSISDLDLVEGAWIQFAAVATDSDLPKQTLNFSLLPGAPEGASIDPQTGLFAWSTPPDQGESTHRITVRVTDSGIPPMSATRAFQVQLRTRWRVVINEIMYHAASSGAEFIELMNASTNTAADLSGWRLSGFDFVFPSGTVLRPSGFLAVARNLAAFADAYDTNGPVLGEFVSRLPATGGTVQLYRPLPAGGEELMDELSFLNGAPWPVLADGAGPSLQLIDPQQDNYRAGNWTALNSVTTNAPLPVIAMTNAWRFWSGAAPPAAGWSESSFDDNGWSNSPALFYVENADLPAPKNTPLTLGRLTYYFRVPFNFYGNPDSASLQISTIVDDGAVFYLNGRQVHTLGMNPGPFDDTTLAGRTVTDAILEGPMIVEATGLQFGRNAFAAEVHQINSTSSDIVFGASVDVLEIRRAAYTPGLPNSVRALLPPFPSVWLNELVPQNQTGLSDAAGEREPWIELYNSGDQSVSLDGWWLTDDYASLQRWAFPPGSSIPARGFVLVWADGDPNESSAAAWHTNFRLAAPSGNVALVRLQNGLPAIVDYLNYTVPLADQSLASVPDGQGASREISAMPTPGGANAGRLELRIVHISSEPSNLMMTWTSEDGARYQVERLSDLRSKQWQPATGEILGQPNQTSVTLEAQPLGQQFYRLIRLP